MDNMINIDPEDILKREDGSIDDADTIRQIGLLGDSRLYRKIRKGFEFAALYSHVMKVHDILPEDVDMITYQRDPNVLNIYIFGSRLYGTATVLSDVDMILVVKEWFDSKNINTHVYTVSQFQLLLDRFDIQALECVFAPKQWVLKDGKHFDMPVIDKSKLRVSISTIASNSWVKGKKKLTVAGDYDLYLAIKSIFHSLRIIDYGIQIASSGMIQNFSTMNYVLEDLRKLSEEYQREELWQKIDDKYRKVYNSTSTRFKELAPKDLSEKNNRIQLALILDKFRMGSYDEKVLDEILNLFQK